MNSVPSVHRLRHFPIENGAEMVSASCKPIPVYPDRQQYQMAVSSEAPVIVGLYLQLSVRRGAGNKKPTSGLVGDGLGQNSLHHAYICRFIHRFMAASPFMSGATNQNVQCELRMSWVASINGICHSVKPFACLSIVSTPMIKTLIC